MFKSSIHTTSLAFIASIAVGLAAPPASAQTPIGGALDFHEQLDVEPGIPIVLHWDTGFRWPFGRRPWISDTIDIFWLGVDIEFTWGMVQGFLDAVEGEPEMARITTVYGLDGNNGQFEPLLIGLDPSEPAYVPDSDERIITRQGDEYFAGEAMTVPIFQLPGLLPGHDLSMIEFADPFAVVHVFRTYAPMSEIWYDCPADMNNDGLLDLVDISAFVGSFLAGQFGADFNFDGVYDLNDLVAFLGSFTAPCP